MANLTIHELIEQQQHAAPVETTEVVVAMPSVEVALLIVTECGLQATLGQSLCLACKHRVMLMECIAGESNVKPSATLYCKELARDLNTSITRCTSFLNE